MSNLAERADEAPPGIDLDVGSLTAFDNRVGEPGTAIELARDGVEPLIHALFSLPVVQTEDGRLVDLPDPRTHLPREKPIPKEREPTKWEKFAKEKGIVKKRRDRLVLDEQTGEYMPRYGRGSVKSLQRDVVLPHKEGMSDGEDPFATKRKEKKQRVKFEEKKQRRNLGRAEKAKGKANPVLALNVAPRGASGRRSIPMADLKQGISVLQRSTASAGKFDKRVKNEPKVKTVGKRRKFEAVADRKALVGEKERAKKVLDRVLMGKK